LRQTLKYTDLKGSTRALAREYAYQSTAIEGNTLRPSDAALIKHELEKQLFSTFGDPSDFASISTNILSNLTLPSPHALLPNSCPAQVAELRNHIIISRYLTEVGLENPGTTGVSLLDIMRLDEMMLEGTKDKIPPRYLTYSTEVIHLVYLLLDWRRVCHASSELHPLILATSLFVHFCHIHHPCLDGNGRIGRVLMADYMVRQGYLPMVFSNMDAKDYSRMVLSALKGAPWDLCEAVVFRQAEMLFAIDIRS
jgi:Fic/DOC family